MRNDAMISGIPTQLYIDGRWREAEGRSRFAVRNPATNEILAEVASASANDAVEALAAADRAQESWASTPSRTRAELLRQLFYAVIDQGERFAQCITAEMGKSLTEARAEVAYGAEFLRWFSEEGPRRNGQYGDAPGGNGRIVTRVRPVGPCLLITPWNFPLAMLTRKLGPALAAGCTTVVKPASSTPLTLLLLARLAEQVGIPAGVINVVPTAHSGVAMEPLLSDSRLRKISFTGSTSVGQELTRSAATRMLRISMELGGNAPFLVLEDADLDVAIEGAVTAKLRNIGQSCIAANRFYVHSSRVQEFSEGLAQRFDQIIVGDGTDETAGLGPLIDEAALSSAFDSIGRAVAEGGSVIAGGTRVGERGHFMRPTVIVGLHSDSQILRQELFAPIAPIVSFDAEEDAIRFANDTEYGLASYVFAGDVNHAVSVARRIECGIVGINRGVISDAAAPFGGVKLSGLGREGGSTGLDEYVETQYLGLPSSH